MQTSFMHPPFGFALFFLRSVAPKTDYIDKITGKTIAKITTGQIYWGAVPFVFIQIIMVIIVISFPQLVDAGRDKGQKINLDDVKIEIPAFDNQEVAPPFGAPAQPDASPNDDIMKQLQGK
jgi:hypothetical protein